MNILVVDVGTSSMRGVLFTHEGNELTEKQHFYSVSYMENSWVEQSPSDWENALYDIMKAVSVEAKKNEWSIDAVTMTSQRSLVIPVDKSIRPLCNAIMWQNKQKERLLYKSEQAAKGKECTVRKVFKGGYFLQLFGGFLEPYIPGSVQRWELLQLSGCTSIYQKNQDCHKREKDF